MSTLQVRAVEPRAIGQVTSVHQLLSQDWRPRPVIPQVAPGPNPTLVRVRHALREIMSIDGALGATLTDHSDGRCLASTGRSDDFQLELAAAGNAQVVRAKLRVMDRLDLDDSIEDILISLESEYHLMFPLPGTTFFLYLRLRRDEANLALTRRQVVRILSQLEL